MPIVFLEEFIFDKKCKIWQFCKQKRPHPQTTQLCSGQPIEKQWHVVMPGVCCFGIASGRCTSLRPNCKP